jgi:hypothetical protein
MSWHALCSTPFRTVVTSGFAQSHIRLLGDDHWWSSTRSCGSSTVTVICPLGLPHSCSQGMDALAWSWRIAWILCNTSSSFCSQSSDVVQYHLRLVLPPWRRRMEVGRMRRGGIGGVMWEMGERRGRILDLRSWPFPVFFPFPFPSLSYQLLHVLGRTMAGVGGENPPALRAQVERGHFKLDLG